MSTSADEAAPRSTASLVLLLFLLAVLFAGFVALGSWQIQRRAWKLDLIERVEQRVHAAPEAAPPRETWAGIGAEDEYRHVQLEGEYLRDRDVYTQAVTARGPGFWLLTPLQTRDGFVVLINRGFVEKQQASAGPTQGEVRIAGLLRLSEPKGGFLRDNDPAAKRWFSRDVAAIAAALDLPVHKVAPYFIDADASASTDDGPVGGMTVVSFHNSHLVYAITWYGLAAMTVFGGLLLLRSRRA
ncbi:SURF1 family protein [Hydrocarboniphaga sp.]|uniref:SURF1 family protein n=1 Tax=Hydrocarboniphaga sp. TaxID=2033016 RepID=UPI003D0A84A3